MANYIMYKNIIICCGNQLTRHIGKNVVVPLKSNMHMPPETVIIVIECIESMCSNGAKV